MQPPIAPGTILQNRYHLIRLLGQGGFGRTYLAEDRGRFDELCAIKEYIPPPSGAYALEKSKELFEREANILYQIQHPQVPQFRAVFEADGRFFLIQDYVEGKTYSDLLAQRTAMGYGFTSGEVRTFLEKLLPVLAHIHDRGMVHRDISPDNIILRDQDLAPVLIDFGVVKEIVGPMQPTPAGQGTTVGKLGYAPGEQVQMGKAYPSSDLYSLGVTAIVLMTGKQPNQLKDPKGQWQWQRYVTSTDPLLLEVLEKLLQAKPGDRLQSAQAVLQALGVPLETIVPPEPVHPPITPPTPADSPAPVPPATTLDPHKTSPEKTLVDGVSPSQYTATKNQNTRRTPSSPNVPPATSSFLDDPVAVIAAGVSIVALAGIASWALVRIVLSPQSDLPPPPSPTPLVVASGTPMATFETPRPTPSTQATPLEPITYQQTLELAPNQPQRLEKRLTEYETQTYMFEGQAQQGFTAYIAGEGVLMTIAGPDQKPLDDRADRVSTWTGTLPTTGDYRIILKPVDGLREAAYSLELTLDIVPTPPPSSSPPDPPPRLLEQTLILSPGNNPITLTGETNNVQSQRYWFNLQQGHILEAQVMAGSSRLNLFFPNGEPVPRVAQTRQASFTVPYSGLYFVDVTSDRFSSFGINLQVKLPTPSAPPRPSPPPTPSIQPSPSPSTAPSPSPIPNPTITIIPAITPTPDSTSISPDTPTPEQDQG